MKKPLPQQSISKAVNPSKLLAELQALGVTGAVQSQKTGWRLVEHTRGANTTDAQIQAVIAAHDPTPTPSLEAAEVANWAQLTAEDKDAILLRLVKHINRLK